MEHQLWPGDKWKIVWIAPKDPHVLPKQIQLIGETKKSWLYGGSSDPVHKLPKNSTRFVHENAAIDMAWAREHKWKIGAYLQREPISTEVVRQVAALIGYKK